VSQEPVPTEHGHLFESPRLLEQVSRSRDDLEPRLASELTLRPAVELDDLRVAAADDEQRRSVSRSIRRVPRPASKSARATA
jgi:hypothetical protein